MAQGHDPYRKPQDVGSDSPASREAKEQGMSGTRGGARAAQDPDPTPGQPAQASGRRGAQHEQPPEERKNFAPGQAPSEQGEKDHPSPHVIAQHQQGIEGRSGSSGGAHGNRAEEESQHGEPRGGHARHGREHLPGDRPRE
ncbi:MAG TPA: hypothetical protein VHG28_01770 [Longimicrobiaceae bacterium]|nr:hypothetical protein [Longimicrobiaceae bacterium]